MYKFVDLFAGIGGFRSGFEKVGMKCVGYCEIDKFARKSYEALYDTNGEWVATDITKVKGVDMPEADIWTFGFPCQDISIAGRQAGMTEETGSGLFYQVMRCLDEREQSNKSKPEWIIAENVKNLLSIGGGWTFYEVLCEMDKRGYDIQWRVFNSKDYGVPQNRERVYIIGHLRTKGRREILFEERENRASIKRVGNYLEGICKRRNPDRGRVLDPSGLSGTITCCGGGNTQIKILEKPSVKVIAHIGTGGERGRIFDTAGISPSVCASDYKGAHLIKDDYRVRKLTPREYWRLQGFTDEQFDIAEELNSNSQLYKQAGNSVTVTVVEEIGNAILRSVGEASEV